MNDGGTEKQEAIWWKCRTAVAVATHAIDYKRESRGRGWDAYLKTWAPLKPTTGPDFNIYVSAIDSRVMHANVGGYRSFFFREDRQLSIFR